MVWPLTLQVFLYSVTGFYHSPSEQKLVILSDKLQRDTDINYGPGLLLRKAQSAEQDRTLKTHQYYLKLDQENN